MLLICYEEPIPEQFKLFSIAITIPKDKVAVVRPANEAKQKQRQLESTHKPKSIVELSDLEEYWLF